MAAVQDPIVEFMEEKVWAVVGASRDPEKYGYRIYASLKNAGYRVYPVNPTASEIDGDRAYPSLTSLPEKPDVVDLVVPPAITERVVEEALKLGIDKLWMQPGSESDDAIELAESHGAKVIHHACAMLMAQGRQG